MSKLKNKIQEGLHSVVNEFEEEDNFDIDTTIRDVDAAINPLPIDSKNKELLKVKALNKELAPDEVMGEGKPTLQQQPNPEYNPDPAMDSRTGRRNAILQQQPNPEFEPSKPRPRLQQQPNPIDEIGDDVVSRGIEHGMNPEGGDEQEWNEIVNQINGEQGGNQDGGLNLTKSEPTNELPFESVNPSMTKDELLESILGKKQPKVIKSIKVKDIKNGQ